MNVSLEAFEYFVPIMKLSNHTNLWEYLLKQRERLRDNTMNQFNVYGNGQSSSIYHCHGMFSIETSLKWKMMFVWMFHIWLIWPLIYTNGEFKLNWLTAVGYLIIIGFDFNDSIESHVGTYIRSIPFVSSWVQFVMCFLWIKKNWKKLIINSFFSPRFTALSKNNDLKLPQSIIYLFISLPVQSHSICKFH